MVKTQIYRYSSLLDRKNKIAEQQAYDTTPLLLLKE
jgi:hypothetical protein